MQSTETAPGTAAAPTAAPEVGSDDISDRGIADRIEQLGLLDPGADADDTESADDKPADDGAGETPPTGEDEGQIDPPAEVPAVIEPPQSMTAEERAEFAKLPPAAQQFLLRRESDQARVIQQRTQEIAEQRKAFESEREAIQAKDRQYVDGLQSMLFMVAPEAEAFAKVTPEQWQQLSAENPAEYVRLRAARDALSEKVGRVRAEIQRVADEQTQAQQKRMQEHLADQKAKLVEKVPEFADAEKAKTLTADLNAYLADVGFSPEEVGQAADHRIIMVARDAMLWRKAEAARKVAETKIATPPVPHVQRPGAAQAGENGKDRMLRDARRELARTGSDRAAAKLIEELYL